MRSVYAVSDNIFSPLGKNTAANMDALKSGRSGIQQHDAGISPEPFFASLFSPSEKTNTMTLTAFEQVVLASARDAIKNAPIDLKNPNSKTGFILSSTKGNISLIENFKGENIPEDRVSLNTSAALIAANLGLVTEPLVVSHACISGLLAMITGMRLISSGLFENIIVSGGDLITSFIYSGFRSFQAISTKPCRPFDAERDGISLGEAAATVILSASHFPGAIRLKGGSVSNDANHISGPSRTGEELWLAIHRTLQQAELDAGDIDFISSHGTATRYNDEMEAKAFHLAAMQSVPVNSVKGYYGHTLGAAGILESIVTLHSMKENILLPTFGFSTGGTELPLNIIQEIKTADLRNCLKTASGFGGCNAAMIFQKN
jgi:3-oxoacyl-[acyl-carrier-protein] synthase-1